MFYNLFIDCKKIWVCVVFILLIYSVPPAMAQSDVYSNELLQALDIELDTEDGPLGREQYKPNKYARNDPFDDSYDASGGENAYFKNKKVADYPILSQRSVNNMKRAIEKYTHIVQKGGWPRVKGTEILKYGDQSDTILALRERLIRTNDLSHVYRNSNVFDAFLRRAVQNFQIRHGIKPSGVVNKATRLALNVSATERLNQLKMNLLRIQKDVKKGVKSRYVLVNIPAAHVEAVERNKIQSTHRAVVGMVNRKTPVLNSKISMVNFNPYWHIPKSIVIKDLIPIVKKDPTYLKRLSIRIFDGTGRELQYEEVDWYGKNAPNYHYRQDPSRGNSLGAVKVHFNNRYAVFLHDTPSKILFSRFFRAYSSGCVRVQNIRQLIYFLLEKNQNWSRGRIDTFLRNGKRADVKLKSKVPIIMTYITAWANESGSVYFRYDLYGRDGIAQFVQRNNTNDHG